MVQSDLDSLDLTKMGTDNLTHEERQALRKLREAKNIIIKRSDKRGNVVLMNKLLYEKEVKRPLNHTLTYKRLDHNLFPEVVRQVNQKRRDVKEAVLLSNHE